MIRKFKKEDLKEILGIEKTSFPKTPYDKLVFLQYAEMYPDNFLVYIEESSDKILGYIIFQPDGHVISIAVNSLYRRRGIGTRLIKEVLKYSHGIAMVEVRESNSIAQTFYKKLGFIQLGTIPWFYEDEGAFVMIYHGRK